MTPAPRRHRARLPHAARRRRTRRAGADAGVPRRRGAHPAVRRRRHVPGVPRRPRGDLAPQPDRAAAPPPPRRAATPCPGRLADDRRRRRHGGLHERLGPRLRRARPQRRLLPQPGPLALPGRGLPRRPLPLAARPRPRRLGPPAAPLGPRRDAGPRRLPRQRDRGARARPGGLRHRRPGGLPADGRHARRRGGDGSARSTPASTSWSPACCRTRTSTRPSTPSARCPTNDCW